MAAKTVTFKLPEKEHGASGDGAVPVTLPKTPHPKKLREQGADLKNPQTEVCGSPQSVHARILSPVLREHELRPQSRPSSEQNDVSLELKYTQKTLNSKRKREDHVVKMHRGVKPSDATRAINVVRERTNSASRDSVRMLKYSVVKLRESLLKIEEEIKRMTRGKNTLELAVQDIRKAISVNQQSVSMQQKKTRVETVCSISPQQISIYTPLVVLVCMSNHLHTAYRAYTDKISTLTHNDTVISQEDTYCEFVGETLTALCLSLTIYGVEYGTN